MKQAVSWTRNYEITHYPKPLQAYITILFVGSIKRKAQPQQTQIQNNLIICAEAHNSQETVHRNL